MADGPLTGKSGLVTGAAGGIGSACALALARAGAAVLVNDLEQQTEHGEETVELIRQTGGTAIFCAGDVTCSEDHARMVRRVVEEFGRLDFAHNNAGVELQASLTETTDEQFDRVITVNLKGVWLGLKHQMSQMLRQGTGGAIVNTSSLAGLHSPPNLGAYVASKHGVLGLTKTAAVEHAVEGIRVNAVCPSAIRTAMMDILPPEVHAQFVARQAVKRLGEPREVADAVVWLCSDAASFVTGIALPVDGGASAL
jgi:NAD(P)-dependent dehydrogenase (short-subunit alcohol dehydrogenase family)